MLRNRVIFICAFLLFFMQASFSYGLDWKRLHEKADKTDLSVALSGVQKNPVSLPDLYLLGLVYLNMRNNAEAGAAFKKILEIDKSSIEARWGLAEVKRRAHLLDESERELNEIIKKQPNFYPAYITLGFLRYTKLKPKESLKIANKALEHVDELDKSNHVRALLLRAAAKGLIAHYEGPVSKLINGIVVLPILRSAEQIQPDGAAVKFALGSYYLLAPAIVGGDKLKAEKYLKQAAATDPLYPDTYVRLAQFYKFAGDKKEYEFYLNKALEIDPGNELALDFKSRRCKFVCE